MDQAKGISSRKYYTVFTAAGAAIAVVFIALYGVGVGKTSVYDLTAIIGLVGLCIAIAGGLHLFQLRRNPLERMEITPQKAKAFLLNNAIILALLVLVVVIAIKEPRFMQLRVIRDILMQASPKIIIALGICFTLLIAGTDLSAGRMVGLAAVVSASMLQTAEYANRFYPNLPQIPIILPILAAIAACMIFGAINGFLVAKYDMHPFIATLAVQVMIYGACSLYFDMKPNSSQPIGGIRADFSALGQTRLFEGDGTFMGFVQKIPFVGDVFGGLSILVPIALIFTIVIWFVLNKTVFGKNVYAIGGNREAAVVSGINVPLTIMGIFILASVTYGVGGVMEAARTAGATNQYGLSYELDAIAACVVGGVSLNGGVGKVSGILSGVLIFAVIQYGLQFIGINPMWQQIVKGIIIAVAVALDMSKYKKK